MAKGKRKCSNVSKVLGVDKKKDEYEKHKCKSSFCKFSLAATRKLVGDVYMEVLK